MQTWQLDDKINNLKSERINIFLMPESEICNKYNVDKRSEALQLIDEEIAELESELSDSIETDERREREFYESARYLNDYPRVLMINI